MNGFLTAHQHYRLFSAYKYMINTGDHQPIRQRLRRVHPARKQIIADYIQDLLAQGCVRASESDWTTPVVSAIKKGWHS